MAGKQQKADRSNKKAEVIAMMKRPKGATLAEIMAATKWQAHDADEASHRVLLPARGGYDLG